MADTLKEYLIALGFKVDDAGLKRFNTGIASGQKAVVGFATAFSAAAATVTAGVVKIADEFTNLYYVSERTGATVENINALTFAGQQIGLAADQSRGALEGLARAMRSNPGIAAYINSMGIKTAGRDTSDVLLDIVSKLKTLYGTGAGFAVGSRIGEMLGIAPDTLLFMEKNLDELRSKEEASRKAYAAAGVDQQKAASASRDFNNDVANLTMKLDALGTSFEVRVLPYLDHFVNDLSQAVDWLTQLDQKTHGVSTAVVELGAALGAWSAAAAALRTTMGLLGIGGSAAGVAGATSGTGAAGGIALGASAAAAVTTAATLALSGDTSSNPVINDYYKLHKNDPSVLRRLWNRFKPGPLGAQPRFGNSATDALMRRLGLGGVAQAPLGIRNNNPGNLIFAGQEGSASDGKFAVFPTMEKGVSALERQLRLYVGRGINTIRKIFSIYAPKGDHNDTEAYIKDISKATGLGADQPFELSPAILAALERGIITKESGSAKWADLALRNTGSLGGAGALSSAAGNNVSINQKTEIIIQGGGDTAATGRAVASEQNRVNGDMVRNFVSRAS